MLSDRSYMRDSYRFSGVSLLGWILGGLVAVFILQNIFPRWFNLNVIYDYGVLSTPGIREGKIWTLLTYSLLHGSALHLIINCVMLYFLGRTLEAELGARHLMRLALVAAAVGGVLWLVINYQHPYSGVMGASGVVMGFLMMFACLAPDRRMTFMVFFVLPVSLRPFTLVAIIGGIDVLGLLFSEMPGGTTRIAHSAHLGGMLGGWLYYKFGLSRAAWSISEVEAEPPRWQAKVVKPAAGAVFKVNLSSRDELREEVDRILDKINSQGFGALTEAEKTRLDEARELLSRK